MGQCRRDGLLHMFKGGQRRLDCLRPPTYRQCHSPALQARSRPRSICVADLSPVVHAPGPATAGLTYGHFDATNQSAMFQVFKATDGHLMKLHSVGFTRSTVAVMNTGST